MTVTALRRPRSLPLALATTLALSFSASSQAAEPTSLRESLTEAAGEKFDEGTRLYKASEHAAAREAFLAAYAKSGDRRVLYNVAVCDKALGRYARAITTLRTSLATTDRPLPVEYTQRASESIATLSRYVAFLTVETTPDGVTLVVDGEPIRENPIPLDTGSHTIVASKDGYDAVSRSVTVKAGDTERMTLSLEESRAPASVACAGGAPCGRPRPTSRLRLSTDRADDLVTIDGVPTGRSGIEVELAPGEHHLVVTRPGGPSRSMDVVLRPNETRDLRITLDEKRSGVSPWWFVGGGVVLASAAAIGVFLATRPTSFEGSAAGTLNPFVVPASFGGGAR